MDTLLKKLTLLSHAGRRCTVKSGHTRIRNASCCHRVFDLLYSVKAEEELEEELPRRLDGLFLDYLAQALG